MQPRINLLSPDLVSRILDEAFQLMMQPGIKVQSAEARGLLAAVGAEVSPEFGDRAHPGESCPRGAKNSPVRVQTLQPPGRTCGLLWRRCCSL